MLKSLSLISIASAVLLLSGCSVKKENIIMPIKKQYSSTLIKLKDSDFKSSLLTEEIGIFKSRSLPAYLGASMTLSQDEYIIKKFNGDTLIFDNYGVDSRLNMILSSNMKLSYEELDKRAVMYGFKSSKDMYEYLYYFLHTQTEDEILYTLVKLEKKDLIKFENFLNEKKVNDKIDELVYMIFNPYIKFENNETLKPEWAMNMKNKKVSFTKDDYRIYAHVILLMEDLLSKNGTVNLYGI